MKERVDKANPMGGTALLDSFPEVWQGQATGPAVVPLETAIIARMSSTTGCAA